MKLLKRHNSMLQKMIIVMIVIVMLFNVVFPSVASAVTIPIVGDIASLLVGAALNFVRFLADIVEGVMQYFFIGGTNSFWIMYKTSALEETEQYFTDAGYTNGDDGFKILYDSLPSDVKSSELIEIPEDQISNWIDNFYNAISSETNLSYNIPVLLFTPDNIFSNRIAAFDINFIDPPQNSGGQETISYTLRETIANWYNALRTLALAGMLVVLVYVGIRMIISTSASDKAKYKNMLMDWLIAVCMLFFLHYIMLFVIRVTESITAMISSASGTGDTWISVEGSGHYIRTNLMGAVRFQAENNDLYVQAGYTVMYIMLVAYTLIFGFRYLKRVINVAFLTIISPLIVIMYPIDKIGDGKAQGFSIWIKEYIFNAMLQPLHLILYTVLLGSALSLANDNPIYAIIALAFISQAEKFLRKIFDFDKANGGTVDSMGFAGGALAMGLMNRYSGKVFGKSGGGKTGANLPTEKNPGKELEKTNKGSYGSFLNPTTDSRTSGNNSPTAINPGTDGLPVTSSTRIMDAQNDPNAQSGQNGQESQDSIRSRVLPGYNGQAWNRYYELRGQGMSEEEAMRAVNGEYGANSLSSESTNPDLINADTARNEINGGIRTVDIPELEQSIEQEAEPDYANMSTMDVMKQGARNKFDEIKGSAKEAITGFREMPGKEKLKTVGRGVVGAGKVAGKIAGKAVPIVGAVAGAATGFALGASTGDLSNAVKGIGIGAGAGAYGGRATTRAITGAVGKVSSGAQKVKYNMARSALGYEGAMKWRTAKVETRQKKEFMKDKDNIAKAKDLAAKVGRSDHMSVMEDMYALKSARVNDDKMIEAAMKIKDQNHLGQSEMVKLASDTSKRSETMLFGQAESKLLVDSLTQSFVKKSGGRLTEQQARSNATRYLENMREMYNESR